MIDILAFAAHPDDVELACAGTLLVQQSLGHSTGIIDLTRGELGTRGTATTRDHEARDSAQILNLKARENLDLGDGFFEIDKESLLKVIQAIRTYKPKLVLANAVFDRHPDHGRGAQLLERACFLAGLPKVETNDNSEAHRPTNVLHYIQDRWVEPDIVVDVSAQWKTKIEAIKAFKTQFFDPNNTEPDTPISGKEFFDFLEGRAREFGRYIGAEFGEGFTKSKALPFQNFNTLF
jgi:bacillithiol biosynthesis deacetylase BshB1